MTKEVSVSIRGLQTITDEEDPIEIITHGDYYKKKNRHYIIYDEIPEGFQGKIRNTIKVGKGHIVINKKGAVNSNMEFLNGQKTVTHYSTAVGDLILGIWTRDIQVEETIGQLNVFIEYVLEINEEPVTDCKITIKATSRENS